MSKFITQKSDDYSYLDMNTGEIIELKYSKKLNVDDFIMVYFACFPNIMKLSGTTLKILMCCWKYSVFDMHHKESGNILRNNLGFKEFCREQGVGAIDKSIDNAVTQLCKAGLLIRKYRGEYILNPEYFFKGTLTDRSRLMLNLEKEPNVVDDEECFEYGICAETVG